MELPACAVIGGYPAMVYNFSQRAIEHIKAQDAASTATIEPDLSWWENVVMEHPELANMCASNDETDSDSDSDSEPEPEPEPETQLTADEAAHRLIAQLQSRMGRPSEAERYAEMHAIWRHDPASGNGVVYVGSMKASQDTSCSRNMASPISLTACSEPDSTNTERPSV